MRDAVKWAALEFSEWPFKDNKIIPIVVGINDDGSFYTDKPVKEYTCVFFDQWQAARLELGLDKPKWRGLDDGLPPSGYEVDTIHGVCLIKGYYGSQVWYQTQYGEDVVILIDNAKFRPILTEEEKAVKEMFKTLPAEEIASFEWNAHAERVIRAIYRAGYRKQEDEQ